LSDAIKRLSVLLAAMAVMAGCASGGSYSKYQFFENPLNAAVARNTKTAKLYQQLDTIMIVDVIYNDMALRKAWVEQEARARRLADDRKSALLDEQEKEDENTAQFVVALYTADEDWNDLDKKESRWSIFLKNDGDPVRPASIEKVKPEKLKLRDNLPFISSFRSFYLVSFPRERVTAKPFDLVMSGLLGEVKLGFE